MGEKTKKSNPFFLVIGGNKCGTTWFHKMLSQHPELNLSINKEPHFFSKNYNKGYDWYWKNWEKGSGKKGECSTTYFYSDEALDLIHKDLPGVKLIVLLREPLERSLSHLWHLGRDGEGDWKELMNDHPEILENSFYVTRLRTLFEKFSADDLLILYYEDIQDKPGELLDQTCTFLDVEPFYPERIEQVVGEGFTPRSRAFEKFRILVYKILKRTGAYKGIKWFKHLGGSEFYRKLNKRNDNKEKFRNIILPFINHFIRDLSKEKELPQFKERDRKMFEKWKRDLEELSSES